MRENTLSVDLTRQHYAGISAGAYDTDAREATLFSTTLVGKLKAVSRVMLFFLLMVNCIIRKDVAGAVGGLHLVGVNHPLSYGMFLTRATVV